MLALTRKAGETVEIPSLGVTFKVVRLKEGRVQIGIEAPQKAKIFRGELLRRIEDREARNGKS